jgi:hypothetical protein
MTTTQPTPTASGHRAPAGKQTLYRRVALWGGIAYLVTFFTSIPALPLLAPVTDHPDFVLGGGGNDNQVLMGGLLEVFVAFSGVVTAVALYPVTRRVSRTLALGFVTSRLIEGGLILTGVVSILSVVTLRQNVGGPGGDEGLMPVAHALVAIRDWTFLFGPGFMAPVNALMLATIMYKSGLVPRLIPAIGLIGAPILFGSKIAVVFGAFGDMSSTALLLALPIAAWEFSLGLWLTFKGFRPSAILENDAARA